MLVVMTVRAVLKVPLKKAAPPPCPFDVPAPWAHHRKASAWKLQNLACNYIE